MHLILKMYFEIQNLFKPSWELTLESFKGFLLNLQVLTISSESPCSFESPRYFLVLSNLQVFPRFS